jgi:dihydroorotase-like cyclic amidohydrolase
VHSEDESLTRSAEVGLLEEARSNGNVVPEGDMASAELVAIAAVVRLADEAGARVVLAHVRSPAAVRLATTLRRSGSQVLLESCPQYMELLKDEVVEQGPLRKLTSPARAETEKDLNEMWTCWIAARSITWPAITPLQQFIRRWNALSGRLLSDSPA